MKQYLLTFHHFPIPSGKAPSAQELEAVNKQWQNYIGGIAHKGKFVSTLRLEQAGNIITPDGSNNEVVQANQGLIVGNLTLEADSLEEANEFAKTCPILAIGGSVEVRPIVPFEVSGN